MWPRPSSRRIHSAAEFTARSVLSRSKNATLMHAPSRAGAPDAALAALRLTGPSPRPEPPPGQQPPRQQRARSRRAAGPRVLGGQVLARHAELGALVGRQAPRVRVTEAGGAPHVEDALLRLTNG